MQFLNFISHLDSNCCVVYDGRRRFPDVMFSFLLFFLQFFCVFLSFFVLFVGTVEPRVLPRSTERVGVKRKEKKKEMEQEAKTRGRGLRNIETGTKEDAREKTHGNRT